MTGPDAQPQPALTRGQLQLWAAAYIAAWLDRDYWTIARITAAIEDSLARRGQIAEAFSLVAAGLINEAHGADPASASARVTERVGREVAAETRVQLNWYP